MDIDKLPPGKENSDHTKYENLLKDLDKVLIESVSVREKFNATEETKGTAQTNSEIFKGFNSFQSDYIKVEKKIHELCNELESINKEFIRETYIHKEISDDYETKYAKYITQMKELIEKKKTSSANENTDAPGEKNERKAKFDNLLKDFVIC